MSDFKRAKQLFKEGGYTCVFVHGETEFCETARGIAPLLKFTESGKDFNGFACADKIVGKAAALLYVKLRVACVFAEVTTFTAEEILKKNGIALEYEVITDRIINRRGDGDCPMEQAVKKVSDAEGAYAAIKCAYEKLNNK